MKTYFWNILITLDQGCNVILAPLLNFILRPKMARFGDPDETLSSVFGKNIKYGECVGCRVICWFLGLIDPKHCLMSVEPDEGKNSLGRVTKEAEK